MYKLGEGESEAFFQLKKLYDSLSQAVKIAKQLPVPEEVEQYKEELSDLCTSKASAKATYMKYKDNIILSFFGKRVSKDCILETNIIELGNTWYGIYYNIGKKMDLKIDFIPEKDLPVLERTAGMFHYTSSDLEAILPACIDEVTLELYKNDLREKAIDILKEKAPSYYALLSAEEVEKDSEVGVIPSTHAQKRWIQRKMNIKELDTDYKVEAYRKEHLEEVNHGIMESFHSAIEIWHDEEGISYYFDEDNTIYIVGRNTIITLYEEDFGFNKSINRSIVTQQVEVLKEYKKELDKSLEEYHLLDKNITVEIESLDNEIKQLQDKVRSLSDKKVQLSLENSSNLEKVSKKRVAFEKEYNKLFKKPLSWMS